MYRNHCKVVSLFIGKLRSTREWRSHLVLSEILPLYISGEELIWEATMIIVRYIIDSAVALLKSLDK